MEDQLPRDKRAAVRRALEAAFGSAEIEELRPLSGGLSGSGVWRIQVGGAPWLLKIERPADGLNDPARQYACLRLAAQAGVAPPLRFADPEAGVAITGYVDSRPLSAFPGGRPALLAELGDLLRRLHAAPLFPPLVDFPDGVEQLLGRLRGLELFESAWLDARLERWEELRRACRWGSGGLVSSHNDPNPRNLLFDGARLKLIDWETAFRNDPFVDLACAAIFFAPEAGQQDVLLRSHLGRPPGARERARLFLMRQLCRAYYGAVLAASSAAEGWRPSAAARSAEPPPLADIQAGAAGPIDLDEPQGRFLYGAAILQEMARDCASPAFAEAAAML